MTYHNHPEVPRFFAFEELLDHQVSDDSWPVSRPDDQVAGQEPLDLLQGIDGEGLPKVG